VEGYGEIGKGHSQGAFNDVDTGSGNDVVFNNIYNSHIQTGEGNDQVISQEDHATILTGDGEDWVENYGHSATIDKKRENEHSW
jgi:hypothetical protein